LTLSTVGKSATCPGVSTAAQFTKWVTLPLLQALADEGEDCSGGVSTAVFGFMD
jgi:hypothetical protein